VAARPTKNGVGNPLWFIGSALVSFALYAVWGGWQFGLGLTLLLFVHEMGHFVVIRAKGLPATLPIFIPFFGAFVSMRRIPKNVRDEAEIALAGPLAGALAGGACFAVYLNTTGPEAHLWLYLAYFSFLINLLNLAPISPLDGGRVVGAISRWFFVLGFALLAAAFVYTWSNSHTVNLLLVLLAWLWLMQTVARFRVSNREPYYAISVGARIYVSVLYIAMIASLALAFYVTQNLLSGFPLFFQ
jgi:Zn-dependent protease